MAHGENAQISGSEQGMVRGLHMQEPPKKTAIYAENPRLTDSDAKSLMLTR